MRTAQLDKLTEDRAMVFTVNFARGIVFAIMIPSVARDHALLSTYLTLLRVLPLFSIILTFEAIRNFERAEVLVRRVQYTYVLLVLSGVSNAVATMLFLDQLWEVSYTGAWKTHVFCIIVSGVMFAFDVILGVCLRTYENALAGFTEEEERKPKTE